MIAGFETPTAGALRLEGVDVSRTPPYRRNVNTVFQHYALFPHMTVWDNVAFGPRSKKLGKAEVARRVDELLEVVRLTEFAKRKPAQLSGGQQQRVALARALVNYPSALLLDEPLGALDLKLRQVMQFELKRIQREVGITFVYVTHDQEEALTMSDRIAVMDAGAGPADRHPGRDLRPARQRVRGRLHRPGQPVAVPGDRHRRRPRRRRPGASSGPLGTTLALGPPATPTSRSARDATLMVRPERVRSVEPLERHGPPADAVNAVEATVTDLTFQGPLVRLSLAAPDGSPIVAQVGHDVELPLLRPGDTVWASWPAVGLARAARRRHPHHRDLEEMFDEG